jgi:serine/threonine protein kinase
LLRIGELVDGRYVVESLLGQGGLAEVYRVRHQELNSVHALKMLTWRRKSLAERMLLEGRIQAQIRHPYVVAVTDVIRHEGRCGLLMELVDGQNLEHYLLQHGALSLDDGLQLFAAILAAVTAAHDAGVLHRDLKPANVLLAPSSSGGVIPKVADFGIAKVVAEDLDQGFTAVGSLMGSPGYLAPEQTRDSGSVDKRADIYALAVILYEILSGGRAFPEANDALSAKRAALTAPPSLHTVRDDLPDALVRAIQKAMSPDIDTRHPDCRALARDVFADHPQLLQLVERQQLDDAFSLKLTPTPPPPSLATLAQGPLGATTTPLSLTNITVAPATTSPPRRSTPLLTIITTLLLGATIGGGILYTLSQTTTQAPPITQPDSKLITTPDPEPITEPEPAAAPEPELIAEPVAEPVAEPEPTAAPAAAPEPELVAAPEPEPEPEVVVVVEEAPSPDDGVALVEPEPSALPESEPPPPEAVRVDPVLGVWAGTANGQRFQLEIVDAGDGAVRSTITFFQGSNQRTVSASGRYEPSSGALVLRSDEGLVFRGVLQGGQLAGSYQRGGRGRSFAWSVSRG